MEEKLESHFFNLYQMALADNELDTKELEMLYLLGEEKGISKTEIDSVVLRPDKVKFTTPETTLEKIECLYDFARIAWADGKIDKNEKSLMQVFTKKFGFEEANIPTIIQFLIDEAEKGTSKEDIFKVVTENL